MEIPVNLVASPLMLVRRVLLVGLVSGLGLPVLAASPVNSAPVDVQVMGPWIRPAVKGQSGTGGYMRLLSPAGSTLVGFSSPVAGVAELHEMSMDGDVMRMRPVKALPLPAGQVVALKPGSYHLMLMKLKRPLKVGEQVPLSLQFKAANGQTQTLSIQVPIQMSAPVDPSADAGASPGQHHPTGHMSTMPHKGH